MLAAGFFPQAIKATDSKSLRQASVTAVKTGNWAVKRERPAVPLLTRQGEPSWSQQGWRASSSNLGRPMSLWEKLWVQTVSRKERSGNRESEVEDSVSSLQKVGLVRELQKSPCSFTDTSHSHS